MLIKVNNKFPTISDNSYIAPSSSIIGDVILNTFSSIWFGAVVRADNGSIRIGERTNIQDNSVIHSDDDANNGNNVTIGHGVICHAKNIIVLSNFFICSLFLICLIQCNFQIL